MHCLQCTSGRVKTRCANCDIVLALCSKCADEIQQNFCTRCYTDGIAPLVFDSDPPLLDAHTAQAPA